MFLIKRGTCEVVVAGPGGEDKRVVTLEPGDCCGQTALLEGRGRRTASVRALEPLEVSTPLPGAVTWGRYMGPLHGDVT